MSLYLYSGQFAVISLQFRHLQDLIICDKCISSLKDLREINNNHRLFIYSLQKTTEADPKCFRGRCIYISGFKKSLETCKRYMQSWKLLFYLITEESNNHIDLVVI